MRIRSLAGLWLLVAMVPACKCGDKGLQPVDACKGVSNVQADKDSSCSADTECADHYTCASVKDRNGLQCCVLGDRKCNTEADCCPGQTCPESRKKCFDKYLNCNTDEDCGDKGDRFCEAYTDNYGPSNRCRFKPCSDLGSCPNGQYCFQGECMASLPCDGTCPAGAACVPSADFCQLYAPTPNHPEAACPMSCNAGFIGTFKDSRNIWDSCVLPQVKCVCGELPGLQSEDLGRYSSVGVETGKNVLVSAYDGQYGDLVVFKYGLDGQPQGVDYVDGVPEAMAKFGPSGARKGVVEPGDDVGRYTDLAVGTGGVVYVSYYDVTHGDLKVAVRSADGKWTTHKVDGDTGDVGLYSSLALDSSGKPAVAYFQRGAEASFDISQCPGTAPTGPRAFVTALKLARASTATPSSPSDWKVQVLACQSRPVPPCLSCGTGTECADPGTGPSCFSTSTSCTACDPQTEVCVTSGTSAVCAKRYNPSNLADVTDGVGVFTSLAMKDTDAIIAFMKRVTPAPMGATRFKPDGDLYGIRVPATGTPGPLVLLDGTGDTGYFPDVKIDPATKNVAIAYHDFTSKALKYYSAVALQTGVTPEVIDPGAGAAGSGEADFVGTDSALVFGDGKLYAVYQDSTKGDLKVAKRTTTWQVQPSPATMGAVGFFADGVFEGGTVYASHARIHARLLAGEPHVDNSIRLELIPAK